MNVHMNVATTHSTRSKQITPLLVRWTFQLIEFRTYNHPYHLFEELFVNYLLLVAKTMFILADPFLTKMGA